MWSFGTHEPSSLYGPVPIPCVAALTSLYMSRGRVEESRCRGGRVQLLLERVDAVVGGQLLAVVELDPLAQREVDRLRVDDLPARRERRLEVEVLVPLEQRLVHRLPGPPR